MKGHPDRLQRGGAESIDGRAGNSVGKAPEQSRNSADIEALLVVGQSAPHHDVVDRFGIQSGHLVDQRSDAETGQIVGTDIDQRALVGPPDRRPSGVDDHG